MDPKDGDKVFKRTRNAVKELTKLLEGKGKDKDVSVEAQEWAQMAIDELALANRILATTLLSDLDGTVAVDPKRQDKVDKELAKAEEELAKGDSKRDEEDLEKAMEHYHKAWDRASKAAKEAVKEPKKGDDDGSSDDEDSDDEDSEDSDDDSKSNDGKSKDKKK